MDFKKTNRSRIINGRSGIQSMADNMKQAIYVKQLAKTFEDKEAGVVKENEIMPELTMINALGAKRRFKFIELRHQYVKETIQEHKIEMKHTPSE